MPARTGQGRAPVRRRYAGDNPDLLTRLRRDALQTLAAGRVYRDTLLVRVPTELKLRIGQRWPGDAGLAPAIPPAEVASALALVTHPTHPSFPQLHSPT